MPKHKHHAAIDGLIGIGLGVWIGLLADGVLLLFGDAGLNLFGPPQPPVFCLTVFEVSLPNFLTLPLFLGALCGPWQTACGRCNNASEAVYLFVAYLVGIALGAVAGEGYAYIRTNMNLIIPGVWVDWPIANPFYRAQGFFFGGLLGAWSGILAGLQFARWLRRRRGAEQEVGLQEFCE
jgi:hypothetical protein